MGVGVRRAARHAMVLQRARRSPQELPQEQRDPLRSAGPGLNLGSAALTAPWVGGPAAGGAPVGLLQALQRTVGNQATARLLQRQGVAGAASGIAVQRVSKKQKGKAKKKTLHIALKRKVDQTLKIRGLSNTAYRSFLSLLDQFDDDSTLVELKGAQQTYFGLLNTHHLALNMVVAPHPAGAHIADHAGNLVPPYAGAARGSFYPSGYTAAANLAWSTWCAANTNPATNLVHCPGHGRAPHPVPQAAITIDHIVSVCTHWNAGAAGHPAGRDCTRAQRSAFFNDVANHTYLCGPCNTAKGSGGSYYQQKVGNNFRN